jgi:hypothetical protein
MNFTPLCPAGHLPHRGGDQLSVSFHFALHRYSRYKNVNADVISPPVGEMGGSPEGGA